MAEVSKKLKEALAKEGIDLSVGEMDQLGNLISRGSELTDKQSEKISAGADISPKVLKALIVLGAAGLGAVAVKEVYKRYKIANEEPHAVRPLNIPSQSPFKSALKKPGESKKPKKSVRFGDVAWEQEFEIGSAPDDIDPYST